MAFRLLSRSILYIGFLVVAAVAWFNRQRKPASVSEPADIPLFASDDEVYAALQSPQSRVRRAAVEALAENPRADHIPHLTPLLDDPSVDVREAVIPALVAYGEPVVDGVAELLQHGSLPTRESAVQVLAQLSTPRIIPPLAYALQHDYSNWVRIPAAQALVAHDELAALATALQGASPGFLTTVREALQPQFSTELEAIFVRLSAASAAGDSKDDSDTLLLS